VSTWDIALWVPVAGESTEPGVIQLKRIASATRALLAHAFDPHLAYRTLAAHAGVALGHIACACPWRVDTRYHGLRHPTVIITLRRFIALDA
jgi:hypothetical protein